MNLPKIKIPAGFKSFGYSVKRNLPTILSIVGCIGVPATAVLSSIATLKAKKILDAQPEDSTFKEDFKAVAKHYIPTVITGIATMGSIVGANKINLQRNAAMAAAGSALAAKFMNYKETVKEVAGEEVVEEIEKRKVKELVDAAGGMGAFGENDLLIFEPVTETLIATTTEKYKDARYDFNYKFQKDHKATINDLIGLLGGDYASEGDFFGWDENNEIQYSLWYEWQLFSWIDITLVDDEYEGMMVKRLNYDIAPMHEGDYPLYPDEDDPAENIPFDVR